MGRRSWARKKKKKDKLFPKGCTKVRDEVTRAEHFNSGGTGFHEEVWNKRKTRQKEKNSLRAAMTDFNRRA